MVEIVDGLFVREEHVAMVSIGSEVLYVQIVGDDAPMEFGLEDLLDDPRMMASMLLGGKSK
jgi:hypothetical protein